MNYEEQAAKANPFSGLSHDDRIKMLVYFNHVASPSLSLNDIVRRWHVKFLDDEKLPIFDALELASRIKNEIANQKKTSQTGAETGKTSKIGCVVICLIGAILFSLLIWAVVNENLKQKAEEESVVMQTKQALSNLIKTDPTALRALAIKWRTKCDRYQYGQYGGSATEDQLVSVEYMLKLYHAAVERGDTESMIDLGEIFEMAKYGVDHNYEKAFTLYCEAYDKGNMHGLRKINEWMNGEGKTKDDYSHWDAKRAYENLENERSKALKKEMKKILAEAPNSSISEKLEYVDECYEKRDSFSSLQAVNFLEKIYREGSLTPSQIFEIAERYRYEDKNESELWLKRAAQKGHIKARQELLKSGAVEYK